MAFMRSATKALISSLVKTCCGADILKTKLFVSISARYRLFNTMATRMQNPLLPQYPFACQMSGPSGCGKTVWIRNLLKHPDSPFDKVAYFYSLWQPLYEEMCAALGDAIEFVEGLPTESPEIDTSLCRCIVFDDLMDEVSKSVWAAKLYTAGCHHQNLSVVSLQQKLFTNREQRLQCH